MFINLAASQFECSHDAAKPLRRYEGFFKEYFHHFERLDGLDAGVSAVLAGLDRQETLLNIARLETAIDGARERIEASWGTGSTASLRFVFFVGCGSWDGHALLAGGVPFVFFDMGLMNQHLHATGFALETHVLHEMIHGLHYAARPEYYFSAHTSFADSMRKRLIAEGLASYLSSRFGASRATATWFGLLSDDEVRIWERAADHAKPALWKALQSPPEEAEARWMLEERLFYPASGPDGAMIEGRFAYHYGFQVIEQAAQANIPSELLSLPIRAFEPYLAAVFTRA